jgi:hypothetical protein
MPRPRFHEGEVVFYQQYGSYEAPQLATVVAANEKQSINPYIIRLEDGRELYATEAELETSHV